MRLDVPRSCIVFCALLAATLVIALGYSTPPIAATESGRVSRERSFHGKTMLVGVVLPEGCLPGHTCSASLVTNPDDFADTPGIAVREIQVPDHRTSAGHATLRGLVVASNLEKDQPAAGPIAFKAPERGSPPLLDLTVAIAELPNEIVDVPVGQLPPERTRGRREHPSMPPIVPDSGLLIVRDRFTGDSRETQIKVNGSEVPSLAQSQSVLAIAPREALHSGKNDVEITNGGRTTYYEAWNPDVSIDADKTTLEQGESTQFRVKVKLGVIPHSYWSPDGKILLTIKNDSESTTSISDGDNVVLPLQESDFVDGTYTHSGTITAKQPGPIQIEASTSSQLEDAPPTRTETRATPTPTERRETPIATETPRPSERTPNEEETPNEPPVLGPPVIYVPGTPVPNAPECCVITGITITNTSNERVFYILNGSYVAGMSPPPDQWVDPGQSRTFKGDFGECVRIEAIANRGEDENGRPLTGVFVDQTVCCKDILTGTARLKGIAVKVDSIEWREWKNCPEKTPVPVAPPPPLLVRRTPTPTPVKVPRYKRTPTATSTSTETSTETETPTFVPYTPETPIIYRPGETPLCCGITGNWITYPITSDPMAVPTDPAAPRDVAAAGYQVLLHNGAFFQNEVDLSVNAVAFPMEWTRHWRGKLTFQDGGVIGDGWDFSYNKRIVPISEHRLANGLFAEQIGVDKAQLVFYNGGDQAESEKENHSENRDVFNFDTHFQAYVTTYEQSPGMFHEIERYILTPSSPHPFAGHVNVELNERLFYVLREKNGVRYVFNCRGQLIYILSPHDSTSQHVRVELQYLGPISPLTQNPTLSKIIDPSGHEFTIDTTYIHQGGVFTNYKCQLKQGSYPVPRIKRISGVGLTMEYNYRGDNSEPILESATLSTYDSTQTWKYTYDSSNRLVSEKLPNESAKGDTGQAYFVNQYDGNGRVFNQTLGCGASATKVANSVCAGDIKSTIDYASNKVTVTDAAGGATDYVLQYIGPYPVIQSSTVRDPGGGDSWTTRFEHNVSTQLTRQINPRNNGLSYLYDISNDSVTLGPIRDWVGHYTYEHDLAYGNLKSLSLFTPDQKTITATNTYEKLYNQIETTKDPLGNMTTNDYEYAVPGNRGNPVTVHSPPVAQPDGGSAPAALTKYTYTPRGQRETVDIFMEPQSAAASLLNRLGIGANKHRITTYRYDGSGYLKQVYFPGGAVDTYQNTNRGEVKEQSGNGGTVTYARNGRGLVVLKTVGPYNYKIWTRFDYDLNDNITDTTLHVEDAFLPDAAKYGVYDLDSRDRVLHTDYDVLKRPTGKTTKADGKTLRTADEYDSTGQLGTKRAPAFSGTGEFVTTFKYDSRGLVTYETQAANTKAAITTHNVYDENGNVKRIETSGGGLTNNEEMQYDYFDRLSSKTDLLGSDYVFEYDSLGNVVHAEVSGSPGVTGDPNAEGCSASSSGEARQLLFSADYKFDAYRHLIYKNIDALGGGRGAETRWFYDGNLQLVKQKSPAGGETSFQYNDAGHVVHVTDPAGNETVNVYDRGNLASIEETDVENIFDPNTASYQTSKNTYVTTNSYDAVGRLTLSQAPASTQRFFYDSAGEVRGAVSSNDGLTLFRYDGFGRRIKLTHGDTGVTKTYTDGDLVDEETATTGNGTTVTSHEQFQYDAMGRTLKRKNLLAGQESTFKYDGLGREYLTIDPNSTAVRRVFNDGGLATTVTIDAPSSSLLGRKANGMLLPGVTGINSEAFNYDGLGRVVCADADQPFFEHGQSMRSEVSRSYDGLGRILTETQSFFGLSQTVKHDYDPEGKWADLVYPDMAGGVRLRNSYDTLGRAVSITLDGSPVASYVYNGTDRIAKRTAGNGAETRFEYDDRRRLVRTGVVDPGALTSASIWSETATYNEGLLATVSQLSRSPDSTLTGGVTSTTLGYDGNRRLISSSTYATSLAAGQTTSSAESGIFSDLTGGRLNSMAEYVRDDVNNVLRIGRVDTFTYDSQNRVDQLSSVGALAVKSPATPISDDDVSSQISHGSQISASQKFTYDYKGNLLWDGRFVYSYDFEDRLVGVYDSWQPWGYGEGAWSFYDAFGRRVQITPYHTEFSKHGLLTWAGGEWLKTKQFFVYDGLHVIAEIVRDPPAPAKGPVMLARYFFGANAGERLRMDRRPDNNLAARLQTYYLHEDLKGNIPFVTDDSAKAIFVENREPAPGTANATAERPPGDENYLQGQEVRMPYLGATNRVDTLAGTILNEDAKRTSYSYRSAYNFSSKLDQTFLETDRLAMQNEYFALAMTTSGLLAGISAAPLLLDLGLPALITATKAGATGAGISGATNFFVHAYNHEDYSKRDFLTDMSSGFALSFITGGLAQGYGIGEIGSYMAGIQVNSVYGTLSDVAVGGRGFQDALAQNTLAGVQQQNIGSVISTLPGLAGMAFGESAAIENSGESVRDDSPAAEQRPEEPAARDAVEPPNGPPTLEMRDRGFFDCRTEEEQDLRDEILTELDEGNHWVAVEAARRLRAKPDQLNVVLRNLGVDGPRAKFSQSEQAIIINTKRLRVFKGGAVATDIASSIVHEFMHSMGLGEVEAYTAQTEFLIGRLKAGALRYRMPWETSDMGDVPSLTDVQVELVTNYLSGNFREFYNLVGEIGYTPTEIEWRREDLKVDPFIANTPYPPTPSRALDAWILDGRRGITSFDQ